MKENIQVSAEYLANLCLDSSEKYYNFTNEDFVNATIIFMTFLMDKVWENNPSKTKKEKQALAKEVGETLKGFIFASTKLKMYELVKYDNRK